MTSYVPRREPGSRDMWVLSGPILHVARAVRLRSWLRPYGAADAISLGVRPVRPGRVWCRSRPAEHRQLPLLRQDIVPQNVQISLHVMHLEVPMVRPEPTVDNLSDLYLLIA